MSTKDILLTPDPRLSQVCEPITEINDDVRALAQRMLEDMYEAENNLLAVCLQHEIDHLDGVTMVDHLPPLKRAKALQECERAMAEGARPGETE